MAELHRGDIVLLSLADPNGHNEKVRPVVIVSAPGDDDGPLVGVSVSS